MTEEQITQYGEKMYLQLCEEYPDITQLEIASILLYTSSGILYAALGGKHKEIAQALVVCAKLSTTLLTVEPTNATVSVSTESSEVSGVNREVSENPIIQ